MDPNRAPIDLKNAKIIDFSKSYFCSTETKSKSGSSSSSIASLSSLPTNYSPSSSSRSSSRLSSEISSLRSVSMDSSDSGTFNPKMYSRISYVSKSCFEIEDKNDEKTKDLKVKLKRQEEEINHLKRQLKLAGMKNENDEMRSREDLSSDSSTLTNSNDYSPSNLDNVDLIYSDNNQQQIV